MINPNLTVYGPSRSNVRVHNFGLSELVHKNGILHRVVREGDVCTETGVCKVWVRRFGTSFIYLPKL